MKGNRVKELVKMAESEELIVVMTERTTKHIKMLVEKKDGTNRQLILCSGTPGDHRAVKKIRAQFRRVAKGRAP